MSRTPRSIGSDAVLPLSARTPRRQHPNRLAPLEETVTPLHRTKIGALPLVGAGAAGRAVGLGSPRPARGPPIGVDALSPHLSPAGLHPALVPSAPSLAAADLRAGQKARQQDFLPAASFQGARPGYYFTRGERGQGYYLDLSSQLEGSPTASFARFALLHKERHPAASPRELAARGGAAWSQDRPPELEGSPTASSVRFSPLHKATPSHKGSAASLLSSGWALEEASRWLDGGAGDLSHFQEELASLEATAAGERVHDIRVSAMAFDALHRLVDQLPESRSALLKPLLRKLELTVYSDEEANLAGSGRPTAVRPPEYLSRVAAILNGQAAEQPSQQERDDSRSTISGDLDPELTQDSFRSGRSTLEASMRNVMRVDRVLVDEEGDPHAAAERISEMMQVAFGRGRNRRIGACDAEEIDREEQDLGTLPDRYADRVPYFVVARLQRWQSARVREQMKWSWGICSNIEQQQNAQFTIITMGQELTHGSMLAWYFAFWRVLHEEDKIYERQSQQVQNSMVARGDFLWRILNTWSCNVKALLFHGHQDGLSDRRMDATRLKAHIGSLEDFKNQLSGDLEIREDRLKYLTDAVKRASDIRQTLEDRFEEVKPSELRARLGRTLQLFFDFAVPHAGLGHVKSKWALLGKDLINLAIDDMESVTRISKLPADQILVRWIGLLLLEAKTCAATFLDKDPTQQSAEAKRMWAGADAQRFSNWCRLARGTPLIEDLGESLKDGQALILVCAMINAQRRRRSKFDPADLWLIGERDPEARAEGLCRFLHALAPSRAARSVLTPNDILHGNAAALKLFIAALFLADPPSLGRPKEDSGFESPLGWEPGKEKEEGESPMMLVIKTLEQTAGVLCHDPFVDPHNLLVQGEELPDLFAMHPHDLLLRWFSIHLRAADGLPPHNSNAINNLGEDLSDGSALLKVVMRVAPEVARGAEFSKEHLRTPEERMKAILWCSLHVTGPLSLTAEAIAEGQEDAITCFVGSLFIARPHLPPRPDSPLTAHLKLLEETIDLGHSAFKQCFDDRWDKPTDGVLHGFCHIVSQYGKELQAAVDAVTSTRKAMDTMVQRMHCYIGQLNAMRAQNQPLTYSHSDGPKDKARYAVHECLRNEVWVKIMKNEAATASCNKIRRVFRCHVSFIAEMFTFYGLESAEGDTFLHLGGISRLCKDCRFTCPCMALPLQTAEVFFYQILAESADVWAQHNNVPGLNEMGFLKWIMRVSAQSAERTAAAGNPLGLKQSIATLFEKHLKPFACSKPTQDFDHIAHDPEVRSFFTARENLLRSVFDCYARQEDPAVRAAAPPVMQALGILVPRPPVSGSMAMSVADFEAVLSAARVQNLGDGGVRSIFENVTTRGYHPAWSCPVGLALTRHSDEWRAPRRRRSLPSLPPAGQEGGSPGAAGSREPLGQRARKGPPAAMRYCDFELGLLVAALYHSPNPLQNLYDRLHAFFDDHLVPLLMTHWRAKEMGVDLDGEGEEQDPRRLALRKRMLDALSEVMKLEDKSSREEWERGALLETQKAVCKQVKAVPRRPRSAPCGTLNSSRRLSEEPGTKHQSHAAKLKGAAQAAAFTRRLQQRRLSEEAADIAHKVRKLSLQGDGNISAALTELVKQGH